MVLQVVLLMWLRTTINWQYRNGGTILEAFSALYAQGGVLRFYQGAPFALIQGPLSRFGDTAANEGVKDIFATSGYSVGFVTFCASIAAAMWRIVLTPVDTIKTTLQVSGSAGIERIQQKVAKHGVMALYDGAFGNWFANIVGHYPWFVVNNFLEARLPEATTPRNKMIRRAFIGFCSSVVSDCLSNSIRVVKTVKQTSEEQLSYLDAFYQVLEISGVSGLLFRGLGIKLISNAISSILFSVLWKMLMDHLKKRENTSTPDQKKK